MQTFTTTNGSTLSYRLEGTGPLVVLLPGGPGLDPVGYFAHAELSGFQQLIFGPRGAGASSLPSSAEAYRIADYVADLEELRKHLKLEQLVLYGSSHGASIALAYASAHPYQVERLVLANGPARLDGEFQRAASQARERFARQAPDGAARLEASDRAAAAWRAVGNEVEGRRALREMMDSYVATSGPREVAYLDRLCTAPVNLTAPRTMLREMMSGLDLLSGAGRVVAPTLVLSGDLDVRVPAEHMEQIAEMIPDARLRQFPGLGHLAHVEDPATWAEAVQAFLGAKGGGLAPAGRKRREPPVAETVRSYPA